ncbi:MAG: 1-acyl-sn-glycerol-3-phosphate acyltransferase [Cyclobacteriaceae bacterium]|nr:1-acyl-sn-glycerol-3-phosphate acyltransferase [Cyclobacteriaceae bacterium]
MSQDPPAIKPKYYPPILPGHREWPVVRLAKNRKDFVSTVVQSAVASILEHTQDHQALIEELELTLFLERNRLRQNPWKVDPEDEEEFWGKIKGQLVHLSQENSEEARQNAQQMLEQIVSRYAEEIAGNFKQSRYRFARTLIIFGFARLLNAARLKGIKSLWSRELDLPDKIQINGEIDQLRALAKLGTVVMVPTHFSNLDSALIGWVIQHLGLPAFIYGAGLNLFNIGIFAYFMNSLGAYKVDRRKKNMVYLETLKTYSTEALKYGCHSLFFPGGTRSRSGMIEKKLKMGLLSTVMEAQRCNFENHPQGEAAKIFVVPVVLNYHFVLEAPGLINQFLEMQGQERYYVENDEFSNSYKIIKFLFKFFTKGSDISVSIGRGMDVMGNYVNDQGISFDQDGNKIDTSDYFKSLGRIQKDDQRDGEYTRMLSERIVSEFHRNNRVFSSHLVAFAAFQILKNRYNKLDLFNFLRIQPDELVIDYAHFLEVCATLRNKIFEMNQQGALHTAEHLKGKIEEVVEHGLYNVGLYHAKRPALRNKQGLIVSQDLNLLYFYHNRLQGYGLEQYI